MSLKRAGLTGRLNNQPRFTGRRITLNRVSLRRFPFPSAPPTAAPVYVEDVFATFIYEGNGTEQSISNNIRIGDGATTSGWIVTLSSSIPTTDTYGEYATVDSSGNVYVCGTINTGVSTEFFIAKYNSSGILQWQKLIGGAIFSSGYSVSVDNNNDVYVCGSTPEGSPATEEFLIIKYNPSGTLQWKIRLGNTSAAQGAEGIKTDNSGNIYVVGYTGTGSGGYDIQLAKYNTTGVIQWQRSLGLGGALYNFGRDIAVDSSGNSYIVGIESVSTNYRLFTAKYDTNGVLQWQRKLTGSNTNDNGQGVAVDSSGNVYVSAYSNTNNSSYNDFIIAKYDTNGVLQWQRRLGTNLKTSFGMSIAVDGSGNVYVNGYSNDNSSSSNRMLIAKYNTSGVLQWQRRLGFSASSIQGRSVAVDTSGTVYVCGNGTDPLSPSAKNITVLAKLPGDGSGTGGYLSSGSFLLYEQSTLTNTAATLANAAGGLNNTATTFSNTASIATETTGNLTSSLASINTGTGFGGLVWMKSRGAATDHALYDTARGATFDLASNLTDAQTTQSTGLTAFTNNGFSIGSLTKLNQSSNPYVSWTFRKQAKFFDVLTYTGTGAARTISHNLGSVPGMIIVKRTSSGGTSFAVFHRSLATDQYVELSSASAVGTNSAYWNNTAPTSSVFSVGTSSVTNEIGSTYVAYLFAHNAGGFGVSGTDNIISCGSYTGTGVDPGPSVTLGYEPQWVLIKNTTSALSWIMADNIRGSVSGGSSVGILFSETTDPEAGYISGYFNPTPTGFSINSNNSRVNQLNSTYIYIAIRRGPMSIPTNGADVFQPIVYTGTNVDNRRVVTNILTDMIMARQRSSTTVGGFVVGDRLRGNQYVLTGSGAAGVTDADSLMTPTLGYGNSFSVMNGFGVGNDATSQLNLSTVASNHVVEAFKRAPGFLDIVAYTGTGSGRTVNHNLGATPEMMWVKNTSTGSRNWRVYFNTLGPNGYVALNLNSDATRNSVNEWNGTTPNTTTFSVGSDTSTNQSGDNHVAYLMSSVPGVSKVSYYVGKGVGNVNQVDCGFTTGARFVIIKSINRTGAAGDWYVYDSARGIVSGNDPYLWPHSTNAEVTNTDYIDTYANGFELSTTAPDELNDGYADYWAGQLGVLGSASIPALVYGDNLWVAGGSAGTIAYSANGYSWTTVAGVVTGGVNAITYGNGLYVAVGGSGRISTSANAITWSTRTSGLSTTLNGVTYGLGKYWAVSSVGELISSTDGVTWATVSTGISGFFIEIDFLNNNLIIVGGTGLIATSSDGITFTTRTSGSTETLRNAIYGNNLYVVVGDSGTILTSSDLVTWTTRNSGALAGNNIYDVVWASYRFVAVATGGETGYSADGITWSTGSSAGATSLFSAAFANDMILVGNSNGGIEVSDPKYLYWAIA